MFYYYFSFNPLYLVVEGWLWQRRRCGAFGLYCLFYEPEDKSQIEITFNEILYVSLIYYYYYYYVVILTYIQPDKHTYAPSNTHKCKQFVCVRVCIYVCVYIYIYIHTYKYIICINKHLSKYEENLSHCASRKFMEL